MCIDEFSFLGIEEVEHTIAVDVSGEGEPERIVQARYSDETEFPATILISRFAGAKPDPSNSERTLVITFDFTVFANMPYGEFMERFMAHKYGPSVKGFGE